MKDKNARGEDNSVARTITGIIIMIFAGIFILELLVAMQFDFMQELTRAAMLTGFGMWITYFGFGLHAQVRTKNPVKRHKATWFLELSTFVLLAISLLGMFVPIHELRVCALWVNVLISVFALFVIIPVCLERWGMVFPPTPLDDE